MSHNTTHFMAIYTCVMVLDMHGYMTFIRPVWPFYGHLYGVLRPVWKAVGPSFPTNYHLPHLAEHSTCSSGRSIGGAICRFRNEFRKAMGPETCSRTHFTDSSKKWEKSQNSHLECDNCTPWKKNPPWSTNRAPKSSKNDRNSLIGQHIELKCL